MRFTEDKSNSHVNFARMQMFNDCIADVGLREIDRVGVRFTRTNRQVDPMRSILDHVLVTLEWVLRYLLVSLQAITRIGPDHVPILLSSENDRPPQPPRFHFETFWVNQDGFVEVVRDRWIAARGSPHRSLSAVALLH